MKPRPFVMTPQVRPFRVDRMRRTLAVPRLVTSAVRVVWHDQAPALLAAWAASGAVTVEAHRQHRVMWGQEWRQGWGQ